MDHAEIEEGSVAESYALGRLPPAAAAEFEEHLLACGECRERVLWAERLHGSLQALAADAADAHQRAVQAGILAWLVRRGRTARLGLVAGLLLVAALPAVLLVEDARLRHQIALAGSTAGPRPASPPPPATATATAIAPSTLPASPPGAGTAPAWQAEQQRLAQELQRRDDQLKAERQRAGELAVRVAELTRPEVNVALYTLGLVRGGGPANRIVLTPGAQRIVLSIDLGSPERGTWSASLLDAGGQTRWSAGGLRATAEDTVVLSFPPSLLPPGAYRLLLTNPKAAAGSTEISFQVLPPPKD